MIRILHELTQKRCLEVLKTEAASTPAQLRKKKLVIFSTKLAEIEALADNWMDLGNDILPTADEAIDAPPLESNEVAL